MKTKAPRWGVSIAFLWAMMALISYARNVNQQTGVISEEFLRTNGAVVCESKISPATPVAWKETGFRHSPTRAARLPVKSKKEPPVSLSTKRATPVQHAENLLATLMPMSQKNADSSTEGFVAKSEMSVLGKIFLSFLGIHFLLSIFSRKKLRKRTLYPKRYCFHMSQTAILAKI